MHGMCFQRLYRSLMACRIWGSGFPISTYEVGVAADTIGFGQIRKVLLYLQFSLPF